MPLFSNHNNTPASAFPFDPSALELTTLEQNDTQKIANSFACKTQNLTPYLGLRSRLSQIWINLWTVLLLLVLVRIVFLFTQLNVNVDVAKNKALSACIKLEDVGSVMASMPHYLSLGVNEIAATGKEKAVSAMVSSLNLVLHAVETIIVFYINFLTGTYVCLITALIHGSLAVVAAVTEDAAKILKTIGVTKEIEAVAGGLEKYINKLSDGIEKSILGKLTPTIPKIDFSKPVDKLKKIELHPSDFAKDVRKLNKNLPDFEGVQNLTKEAISIPFDVVRRAINGGLGGFKFSRDIFPLAQKQKLTFCSNDSKLGHFFQTLSKLLATAETTLVVLLSLLTGLAMIPVSWFEMRRCTHSRNMPSLLYESPMTMDMVYIVDRPLSSRCGINLVSRFRERQQLIMRWCIAYATSVPALFVLSRAFAGLFSCFCQLMILKAVNKEVTALVGQVGDFANEVVVALENASMTWAHEANGIVKGLNDNINDVLGYVTNATNAVNRTINVFLEEMERSLELVFNGTILLDPIRVVLHCVVGIKLESVQKGLIWVHDYAHVSFPLFYNRVFSLGANQSVQRL